MCNGVKIERSYFHNEIQRVTSSKNVLFYPLFGLRFHTKLFLSDKKSVDDLLDPFCETQFWQSYIKYGIYGGIRREPLAEEAGNASLAIIDVA